ncbi:NUDIX domain-containing protein [Streptomyces sp. YIM 98790]|uniref:NUDIX domain-containing protein n=1 Tax=Streptomyces sp. YIM 98790 TaxID=2689077 RepID=UPI00140C497B|nr:NUDIX domain-containing protein [Streptomyces sp. YIM 98790]
MTTAADALSAVLAGLALEWAAPEGRDEAYRRTAREARRALDELVAGADRVFVEVLVFPDFPAPYVLVVRREGTWGLPGGWLARGESLGAAAERVLRDQAGLTGVGVDSVLAVDQEPEGLYVVCDAGVPEGTSQRRRALAASVCRLVGEGTLGRLLPAGAGRRALTALANTEHIRAVPLDTGSS